MAGLYAPIIKTATIADEGTTSDAVTPGIGYVPVSLIMPTGWDAATISFTGARLRSTTYQAIYDEGALYVVSSAAASRNISLEPRMFLGYSSIKVVASAAQTNGPRAIEVVCVVLF